MNSEYTNIYGYVLLFVNILTLFFCLGCSFIRGTMLLYPEDKKPADYNYRMRQFAASLTAILANTWALARMFDSFLLTHLKITDTLIHNTLIDRFWMLITFLALADAALIYKHNAKN